MLTKEGSSPVNLRIDNELIERIKRKARQESVHRDKVVSFAQLIREGLEKAYPEESRPTGKEQK